ncbi:hypothetical protein RKD33_004153 [Streptomyces sp. SAI-129]
MCHVCHVRHRPRHHAEGGAPDVCRERRPRVERSRVPPAVVAVAVAYLASRLKTDFDQK